MIEKPSSLASVLLARDAAPSQAGHTGVATLRERVDAEDILFAKGAATAAGFNPQYRSYDRRPGPPPAAASDAVEQPSAPQAAVQPFQSAVVAFGCIALVLSAGLYFGSRSYGPATRAPAAAPMPALAVVAPRTEMPSPAVLAPEVPSLVTQLPAPVTSGAAEAEDLVARGGELLATGDIATARLFFERAAEAGDVRAALLVGKTFDPAYLDRAGVRGMRGDPDEAAAWYRRARDLGEPDAQRLLDKLAARRLLEAPTPD